MPDIPIKGRYFRAAGAATFSQFWRISVTLVTHLALRRLVATADWGLYDWSETVFLILAGVRDLGLPAHAMRIKEKPFGNLLLVEAVWGSVLTLFTILAAPGLARLFHHDHPQVTLVLQAFSVFLLFEGLAIVPRTFFDSQLQAEKTIAPELARNAWYAITAVTLALAGYGVWSMVIAQVSAAAVYAATMWIRARHTIQLTWLRGQTLRLLVHSSRLCLVWLLVLLVRYVDRLILGYRFSAEILGAYSFAYWLAFIVPTILLFPVARAAYPAFIAIGNSPTLLFDTYRISTLILIGLEVPAALFLFINTDLVVRLLGGTQWVASPAFLAILCFAPLLDPFGRFGGEVLMSRGQDLVRIISSSLTLLAFGGLGILLTGIMGPAGMAWANYAPLGGLVILYALIRIDRHSLGRLAADLAFLYVIGALCFAIPAILPQEMGWTRFAISLVATSVYLAIAVWKLLPAFKRLHLRLSEPEDLSG